MADDTKNTFSLASYSQKTGAARWHVPIYQSENYYDGITNLLPSVSVANGIVYAGSFDHHLYAYKASDGAQLWSFATHGPVVTQSVVDQHAVYVASMEGNVFKLDGQSGKKIWQVSLDQEITISPTLVNGVLYIGAGTQLYAIDSQTGALYWQVIATLQGKQVSGQESADMIISAPIVQDNRIYFIARSLDGPTAYAFNLTDGSYLWRYATKVIGGEPNIQATLSTVFFADGQDTIYALNA
jgi:outer membrane protein assembly factor BamB